MENKNSTAVIVLAVMGFLCLATWWVEDRFGTTAAGFALLMLVIAVGIVIGWGMSLSTVRMTLNAQADFNQRDAHTDRFRAQTFKETASADAAERKANAQISVINARRLRIGSDGESPSFAIDKPEDSWWNSPPNFE